MAKVGRNDPCPCGSGKKYKKCHGSLATIDLITSVANKARNRAKTKTIQRQRQQGLGKGIISLEANGHRLVVVSNRLLSSRSWKSFHDFLCDYIKSAIGVEWGNSEIAKPLELRHPILIWYDHICGQQKTFVKKPGEINSAPMTGASAAYLRLAYDLYALDHNADLQEKLLGRLRNKDNFAGARYEVYVAATMIRAGFDLVFENEDDRNSTHCEFTATHKRTGKKFSVEAKNKAGSKPGIGSQLNGALRKQANHTRIVFIDVNLENLANEEAIRKDIFSKIANIRFHFEWKLFKGNPYPPAYLFLTNTPWHHHLEATAIKTAVLAEGFQITDFKWDFHHPNLRSQIESRERHIEMHGLIRSMHEHSEIPATFDGEIPELAFNQTEERLLIGELYEVDKPDGRKAPGRLTSAAVIEQEKLAYCSLSFQDGTAGIYTWPLSDAEMDAWRKYPDTFFGDHSQAGSKWEDPIELYDFLLSSYSRAPKEKLLELLHSAGDIESLKHLDQPALASIYAERTVYGILAARTQKK